MKLFKIATFFALSAVTFAGAADWASIYHSLIAFDERPEVADGNRPGYVKPIVTNLGAILNSNWAASASIPESFAFEAGMPFALVPITDDDRKYAGSAPTIFGGKDYEWGTTQSMIGSSFPCNGTDCHVVNGNENLNGLPLFTYPYLQLAGSYYHARLVLRGMWLPSIAELKSFSLLGIGAQYSFGHLFQYMLPKAAQGLDVSLLLGYNSSSIGYTPEDYEGQLDLDISTFTFDVVIGYKIIETVEVMLTLGYQSADMESSGHLTSHADGSMGAQIEPTLSVSGNNGFRFGLEVAFSVGGSFHPVVGYDYVGKSSFTTNILYFKQQFGKDKTPDEIAKEKGYVRGGKKSTEEADDTEDAEEKGISDDDSASDDEAVEETPKAKKKKKLKEKKKSKKKKRVVEEDESAEDDGEESSTDDSDEDF